MTVNPVRGTSDVFGVEYTYYSKAINDFQKTMQLHGFAGMELPILENKHLYLETGSDSDIVQKELFTVRSIASEPDTDSTVLRPEGTISVIRALIASGKIDEKALRVFYAGPMFRYNRPQRGRGRQFTQLGCEIINTTSGEYDAEIISLFANFIRKYTNSTLHINTIGGLESRSRYREVLTSFLRANSDKLTHLNQLRVESNVFRVLDQLSTNEKQALSDGLPNIYDHLTHSEQAYFNKLTTILDQLGIKYYVDKFLIRGLDYYRDTVFEFVQDGLAVAGGGRYSFSRARFDNKQVNIFATGAALGLERILLNYNKNESTAKCVIDASDIVYAYRIQQIVASLGIIATLNYGGDPVKYAAKAKAQYIITYDSNDISTEQVRLRCKDSRNTVQLCNLTEHLRESLPDLQRITLDMDDNES